MGYVGNQTTTAFTSMAKQSITGNGGTGYTLTHAVANAQEIEVFVNNVRQEPGVAYTVSGTTLTMTGNVASTDDFYVVFQGKAIQTANHPSTQPLSATTGTFSGDLTVDTNTLVVDATNNRVGIGTTSPQELLHINDSSSPVIRLTNSTTGTGSGDGSEIMIGDADKTLRIINHEDSNVRIDVNGSEAARFTSGGSFLVGSTDPSNRKMVIESTQTSSFVADIRCTDTANYNGRVLMIGCHRNTTNGTYDHISCTIHGEADKLRIKDSGQVQNANGSYTTLSDQRMKENITDASSQWDDIKAIQLRNFNMIGDDLTQLGVIAQELETAGMSGLVGEGEWYDKTANPNNETRKYVKQSILYMKALGALQEAIAKIETLETEMTALKARVTALENA